MNRVMRSMAAAGLVFAVVLASGQTPGKTQDTKGKPDFIGWLCKKLGIDPKIYARVNRGDSSVGEGAAVFTFDNATGAESKVWECGNCWSLTLIGPHTFIVAKEDGLWLIKNGTAAHAVPAAQVERVLGLIKGQQDRLLVITGANGGSCKHQLREAQLDTGQLKHIDSPQECLDTVGNLISAGQIRNEKLLVSDPANPDILLCVYSTEKAETYSCRIFDDRLARSKDNIERVDPQWVSDTVISFIANR